MNTRLFSDTRCANIFFHSFGCLFTFFTMFLDAQRFLILMKSNFSFVVPALGVISKNLLLNPRPQRLPVFSPRCFKSVSSYVQVFHIHFKLICFLFLLLIQEREGEREGEKHRRARGRHQSVISRACPDCAQLGTEAAAQARALTGHQTPDLSVWRDDVQLSHTDWGLN